MRNVNHVNAGLKKVYTSFMRTYVELGHMKVVSTTDRRIDRTNYLLHHAVITEIPEGIPGTHRWGTSAPQISTFCLTTICFSGRSDTSRQSARSILLRLRREASNCFAAEESSDRATHPRSSRPGIVRRTAAHPECAIATLLDSAGQLYSEI